MAELRPSRPTRRARQGAVAAAVVLLAATLAPFHPGPQDAVPWYCVACTPEGGADFVANVAAFLPFGVLLRRGGWSAARATAAGALLSVAIELLQATGIAGRTAVLGDMLANTGGAALGAALASAAVWLRRPARGQARALAAGAAVAWTALMSASTWFQGRDAAPGPVPPRPDALPTVPAMGWYHGRVLAARVGGRALRPPARDGPLIAAATLGADARVALTVAGGDTRGTFVPALAVLNGALEPVLLVGQRGHAAEVRVRTRARRWRLRAAPLVAPRALAGQPEGGTGRTDIEVTLAPGRAMLDVRPLDVRAPGARVAAHVVTPERGWTLVTPAARPWGPEAPVLDLLWVSVPLLPLGAWLRRAVGAGAAGTVRAASLGAAVLVLGLVVGPRLAGGGGGPPPPPPPPPPPRPAAAVAALALGAWRAGARLPPPSGPASLHG